MRYHTVRGALDTAGVNDRKQGRSKYGAETAQELIRYRNSLNCNN